MKESERRASVSDGAVRQADKSASSEAGDTPRFYCEEHKQAGVYSVGQDVEILRSNGHWQRGSIVRFDRPQYGDITVKLGEHGSLEKLVPAANIVTQLRIWKEGAYSLGQDVEVLRSDGHWHRAQIEGLDRPHQGDITVAFEDGEHRRRAKPVPAANINTHLRLWKEMKESERRASDSDGAVRQADKSASSQAGDTPRFYCEEHKQVQPFQLKQMRADVFDTYAICAALLTTSSASRSRIEHRDPNEILTGHGSHTTVHLSYLLQHLHILIACVCTAAGLQSMLVFVLCAMYSRSALAMPNVGAKVFEYFLQQTAAQRMHAFTLLLGCGMLTAANLFLTCVSTPTIIMRTEVPASILDVCSIVCATIVLVLLVMSVMQLRTILQAASIIFMPADKLDEAVGESSSLVSDRA